MSAHPILVIGAGPAGLAAAHAIASCGERVAIVDENPQAGGQIWRGGPGRWHDRRADALWEALRGNALIEWISGARIVAKAGEGRLLLDEGGTPRDLAWDHAVLCTGARELLLPFPGWTLPGVTGAGGLQALVKGGMPVAGKRVVVAGSGPLLLAAASTVRKSGGKLALVAEHQPMPELARFAAGLAISHRNKLAQAIRLGASIGAGVFHAGATVIEAKGDTRLRSVVVRRNGRDTEVECDFLACGFGLVPSLETAMLFGCRSEGGCIIADSTQQTSATGIWAAGESTGIGGVDKALAEGRIAGLAACGKAPSAQDLKARTQAHRFAGLLGKSFGLDKALRALCTPETIVCRCEDVRAAELMQHTGWRSAKLQTRAGMGACQGRVCGTACQFLYGWEAPGLREPVFPTSAAVLARLPDD
ncbi:FAD-dependent oxidoreductase [Massilia cavernae]|uniref:NAD(P)/FAD-dependent oxidoreductase n=1 Tax=Massilia cavernae TaxID=2320864 RepID=A0A418XFZ9_9BURK|nr:FAD-dependent oxidoreductase [Massilia cavernae]RJG11386.1 NAD(P)/FAD-dependent oxidoreductase [Massilia cavernae]